MLECVVKSIRRRRSHCPILVSTFGLDQEAINAAKQWRFAPSAWAPVRAGDHRVDFTRADAKSPAALLPGSLIYKYNSELRMNS